MAPPARVTPSGLIPLAVLAASIVILGAAYAFQYVGGLAPCVLCLYQRYPYWAAIALMAAALALPARPGARRAQEALVYLSGLLFLAGAGIALFHVGVEQHWWTGPEACGALSGAPAATLEELEARLTATPLIRCDEVQWSLFGISMAGYNAILSLGLAAFCLAAPRLVAPRLMSWRAG